MIWAENGTYGRLAEKDASREMGRSAGAGARSVSTREEVRMEAAEGCCWGGGGGGPRDNEGDAG